MTSKEMADLQRRLSNAPAVTPPDDLAERIKRGIPDAATLARAGATRSDRRIWLPVAASVLLLAGATWFGSQWMRSAHESELPVVVERAHPAAPADARAADVRVTASTGANAPQPPYEALENVPHQNDARNMAPSGESTSAPARPLNEVAKAQPVTNGGGEIAERRQAEAKIAVPSAATNFSPEIAGNSATTGSDVPAAAAAPIAAAGSAAASADLDRRADASTAQGMPAARLEEARKPASSRAARDEVARPALAAKEERLFGVPRGDAAFDAVKRAVDHGARPVDVDVAGLVNYFARNSGRTSRALSLQAEISPAALVDPAAILRVSIDSGSIAGSDVIARDAHLSVSFSDAVVAHSGAGFAGATEIEASSIRSDASATLLYRLQLRPRVSARAVIATVRLQYLDAMGRRQTLASDVRAAGADRPWENASLRQRLASLGATWGETLRADGDLSAVTHRAEQLARDEPNERAARELSALANASARLQSSGPIGSGR